MPHFPDLLDYQLLPDKGSCCLARPPVQNPARQGQTAVGWLAYSLRRELTHKRAERLRNIN